MLNQIGFAIGHAIGFYGPPILFFSAVFVLMYFMFGGKRA